MFHRIIKTAKKAMPLWIAALFFVTIFGLPLQAGPCENAFARCMVDVGWTSAMYCAVGWAFCKKYIG